MDSSFADVVAPALGIALSPFPVIPAVLLLFTERPRATSLSFLGGWVTGILVPTGVFSLLADVLERDSSSPRWLAWVRIVLGLLLIGYGVVRWLRRHAPSEQPAWMRSLATATPGSAFRLGLLLSAVNPKALLFAVVAGVAIGGAEISTAASLWWLIGFTMIASLTVAVPVLTHAVLGERVLRPLTVLREWLDRNNSAVMAGLLVVIGAFVLSSGVSAL